MSGKAGDGGAAAAASAAQNSGPYSSSDDPFLGGGGAGLRPPPAPSSGAARSASPDVFMRGASPLSAFPSTTSAALSPGAYDAPGTPAARAQKKRISVDMIGAPKAGTFVHAAHASDAEQAEEILRRWGRDGMGKIADPAWFEPIKNAMRQQAIRNQAEAIAQVQAALHQESVIRDQPRQLHIVNGTASNASSALTTTTATAGHSYGSATSPGLADQPTSGVTGTARGPFAGIAEELRGSDGEARPAPYPDQVIAQPRSSAPPSPQARRATTPASPSPTVRPTPPPLPRTNTGGTMFVASPVTSVDQDAPDYLQFRPAQAPAGLQPPKAIDGLPGSGGRGAIGALFETRPTSMVVREIDGIPAANSPAKNEQDYEHQQRKAVLGDAQLTDAMALRAGAALRPSLTTIEKSVAAKIFFENLYYGILKTPRARDTRRAGLEADLASLRIPESSKDLIRAKWLANETEHLRDIRARVNVNSFAKLKTIGHGAFGVVALVRERGTGELFAMKQLRKADMLRKGQEGHVRAERDLMTSASGGANAKWIVKLVYSFQDVDHLYLIMEFMGGGDLLNLLIEKDIFQEDFARFYVAEMILAIHEAHKLGYIHRDIKPDNFLFTSRGHIKLADFGLCQSFHWAHDGAYYDQQRKNLLRKHGIDLDDTKNGAGAATRARAREVAAANGGGNTGAGKRGQAGAGLDDKELNEVMSDRNNDGTPLTHVLTWRDKQKKKIAYSVVGTNNYMAPEVLRGLGYDQSCDWWSLGVIVFEMLYGYPPFVSKSRHLTRQKILNWRQTLKFPPKPRVSKDAQDFIMRLICEKDDRLGSQSTASVSRPNSLLQGSRQQRSGFAATNHGGASSVPGLADGVEDLMSHPWFRNVDFSSIHSQRTPFDPKLAHPADTRNFEEGIEDEPLAAPGAAEAAKNGQPVPLEQPRDPMLRDKAEGDRLLEMRKQLAFVGYTFKSPKPFDAKTQITESKVIAAERASAAAAAAGHTGAAPGLPLAYEHAEPTLGGSRLRSMSM
ncbi:kinase-like protein [Ceraceosorus guamensis]|uniref:non-specific serine/threonine protein kinase n=1 Tax=Ceraceosorus guamensis TaxID=1522189 RepID=A0A316VPV6_9BASI|nr:kinase-like protein [Ceraceosorus guamensis]PWN39616.1 kinase-like protein [Ceraceosorus guamensis]